MFKKFLRMIIDAENREDAMKNVFYGNEYRTGIDQAYKWNLITFEEHQMLLSLIQKMA